jgi:hypothetical protein
MMKTWFSFSRSKIKKTSSLDYFCSYDLDCLNLSFEELILKFPQTPPEELNSDIIEINTIYLIKAEH